jgi:hypothetical protein
MIIKLTKRLIFSFRGSILETYTDSVYRSRVELHRCAKQILDLLREESLEQKPGTGLKLIVTPETPGVWSLDMTPQVFTVAFLAVTHIQQAFEAAAIGESEFPDRMRCTKEDFDCLHELLDNMARRLPLGSVVQLHGGVKKLMIYGRHQQNLMNNRIFDYVGVPYPEGNLGPQSTFLFDHDSINEVFYFGFTDKSDTAWLDQIDHLTEPYASPQGESGPQVTGSGPV